MPPCGMHAPTADRPTGRQETLHSSYSSISIHPSSRPDPIIQYVSQKCIPGISYECMNADWHIGYTLACGDGGTGQPQRQEVREEGQEECAVRAPDIFFRLLLLRTLIMISSELPTARMSSCHTSSEGRGITTAFSISATGRCIRV
jgi:hypothetical protein